MKVLLINGSPRKNHNTARLLEQAAAGARAGGAETELVHLRELRYTGCLSCFQCKRIGGASYGRCAVKDELRPVLDKAHEAAALVLGTPFYFCAETALMRALEERLWFQYLLYSKVKPPLSPRKKAAALIYTMNIRENQIAEFGKNAVIDRARRLMEMLFAPCETLLACDTLQFDDYSKYDADLWDVPGKLERHETQFPRELEKAFALGERLVS